jgi:hypothetical protein
MSDIRNMSCNRGSINILYEKAIEILKNRGFYLDTELVYPHWRKNDQNSVCIGLVLDETLKEDPWRGLLNAFRNNPEPINDLCDCGGRKLKSTHSHWCSANLGRSH